MKFKEKINYHQQFTQLKKIQISERRYEWFCKYIELIVFFQATGSRKHKCGTIKSRCEINFTTRQLAEVVGLSHMTVSRYLKRMHKEGLVRFSRFKKSKEVFYNNMKFYYLKSVHNKLIAMAKKRAYNFIKKQGKLLHPNNILTNIRNYAYRLKGKYRLRPMSSLDLNSIHFLTPNFGPINFENHDLRRKDLARPRVSESGLKDHFQTMMSFLE